MEKVGSAATNNTSSKSPPKSCSHRDSSRCPPNISSPVHTSPVQSCSADCQHMTRRTSPSTGSHTEHTTSVNYCDSWAARTTQTDSSSSSDDFSHNRRTVPELMASGFTPPPPPASAAADLNSARSSSSSEDWEAESSYTQIVRENAALKKQLREEAADKIYLQRQINGLKVLPGLLQKKSDEYKRLKRRVLLADSELAQLISVLTPDQFETLQRRGVQLRCLGQGNSNSGSLDESVMTSASSLARLSVPGRQVGETSHQQTAAGCDQQTIDILKLQTVMYKEDFDAEKRKADKLERQLAVVMTERSLATDRLRQCETDVMNLRDENTLLRSRLQQVMRDASPRSSESRQSSQVFAATPVVVAAADVTQQQQQQQHRSNSAMPPTTHSAAADVPAAWPCASCTYVNRGTAAYCDMCCKLKPGRPGESSFGIVGSRLQIDDPYS